jgi:hypothetical protein
MALSEKEEVEREALLSELETYLESFAICNYSVWWEDEGFYMQCFLDGPNATDIDHLIEISDFLDEIEMRFFPKYDGLLEMCLEDGAGDPFIQVFFNFD